MLKKSSQRKASISLKLSEFDMPPMQDVLIIGKKAPIGPEAARRMAEALSPEQFDLIQVEHPRIEAILIRKSLKDILSAELITKIILEEAESITSDHMVLRSEMKISISVQREVELN
ncbi:hypothetical protein L1765_10455 [Microaerobacter geothermalis]|uniref:hypothetical protein n=1 Tax=Microaerobacter geothermalis TaxID=674972 RepID=UPI001F38E8FD|nr:hypothetical protein [Microaerobacter geothermalis]MCF6094385.1 hypothetical protein [Microaerobacter geothermalis]